MNKKDKKYYIEKAKEILGIIIVSFVATVIFLTIAALH